LKDFSQDPGLDAQILLMHELGKTKSWVLAHPDFELEPRNMASLDGLANRVRQGEPIPYIIGHWEFYSLDVLVTSDVLIPRPETEMMVEMALEWLTKPGRQKQRVLDMGTGSGCISVALAFCYPYVSIVGVDSSERALKVAQQNAEMYHLEKRIQFLRSSLFAKLEGKFDVICANLPYIPTKELRSLRVSKFEPNIALDGGEDGLTIISTFLRDAVSFVNHPGLILCEYGIGQQYAIRKLADFHFPQGEKKTLKDLQGIPRILSIKIL
jgi:release factor glutamine methyltransferase